jgi:DNA polymerase-3 subunit epsilon
MNTIIAWDTETTGLPLFHEPSEDPRQPHIVQLACAVVDVDSWKTLASLNLISKPNGWTIPDEVAAIHGITTEHATKVGIAEDVILELFLALGSGRTHVAHNSSFDERIVRIALKRFYGDSTADAFKERKFECTQALSTPILKLPPTPKMLAAGRKHHKSANLGEAFAFFTGRDLVGAHDALVDVQACVEVYRAIKTRAAATQPAAA